MIYPRTIPASFEPMATEIQLRINLGFSARVFVFVLFGLMSFWLWTFQVNPFVLGKVQAPVVSFAYDNLTLLFAGPAVALALVDLQAWYCRASWWLRKIVNPNSGPAGFDQKITFVDSARMA